MKPMFRRIADDLRGRIVAGDLRAGDQLPTHEALMAEYATTTVTVRRALDELTREGLTDTRPTVGTFVRDLIRHRLELPATCEDGANAFYGLADRLLTALAGGKPMTIDTVEIAAVVPPKGIADRLGTGDSPVPHRRRLFLAGVDRIAFANDYFAPGLQLATDLAAVASDTPAFDLLAGARPQPERVVEEVFTRMPIPGEMQEAGWPTGMPVLVELRTVYEASGDPIACTSKVLPGDRWIAVDDRPYPRAEPRIRAVC